MYVVGFSKVVLTNQEFAIFSGMWTLCVVIWFFWSVASAHFLYPVLEKIKSLVVICDLFVISEQFLRFSSHSLLSIFL